MARYTPRHDGIVERTNQTIMNVTRSLLKEKNLPNGFWGEVFEFFVYILNRSPTNNFKNRVP